MRDIASNTNVAVSRTNDVQESAAMVVATKKNNTRAED